MPYIKRIRRVPCPGGVPTKRVHNIKCRCGHGFNVDLGPRWEEGLVIRCPECGRNVATAGEDLGGKKFHVVGSQEPEG